METNPIRVCELIVGLVDVNVLGVEDFGADVPLRLHIEDQGPRPTCEECGFAAEIKERPQVEFESPWESWRLSALEARMRAMSRETTPGKPTTRRYSPEEKAQAVRLVRQLRAETGQRHGAVKRVAEQLGYGVESVRMWVRQADIDEGVTPGLTSQDAARIKQLEQENRELCRANEILKKASAFFAAELDRPHRRS